MIDIFLHFFPQIFLLYSLIMVGFMIGKLNDVPGIDISKTLIYFVTPMLLFYASYSVELSLEVVMIPFVIIIFMSIVQYISLAILKSFNIKDSDRYMLAFINSSKNGGYLGIPIASLIFEPNILYAYILVSLGYGVHQSIFGVYLMARTSFSIKQSLKKIFLIPMLYASILGFSLNYLNVGLPEIILSFRDNIYSTYFVFGMLTIGFGFTKFKIDKLSKNFIVIPTIFQFIVWPLLVSIFIYIDKTYFGYFSSDFYKIFLLFSILPVGANVVAFSYIFTNKVSKASLAVLTSTTISLIYIPIMIWYLDIFHI